MSLQELVPSKEICEQLAAAGFPQNTLFYWSIDHDSKDYLYTKKNGILKRFGGKDNDFLIHTPYVYAAPTAEEILNRFSSSRDYKVIVQKTEYGDYRVGFENSHGFWETPGKLTEERIIENTASEALAKFYLYLKSNNLL